MSERKKILLIGRTGNGKSTLCNVISGTNRFKEGDTAASQTKTFQEESFVDNDIEFVLIDTIGIGDTDLPAKDVLFRIAQACYKVRDGLNQVLFVTGGKITDEEIFAYEILRTVIFNKEITKFTTVVRTKFPGFRNPEKTEEDIRVMKENPKMTSIVNTCAKVLHVNNLTEEEEPEQQTRRDSRTILMTRLAMCREVYNPQELRELDERIRNYMTETERLEKLIAQLRESIREREEQTRSLQVQIDGLQRGNQQLHLSIAERERAVSEMEEEIRKMKAEAEAKRVEVEKWIREIEAAKPKVVTEVVHVAKKRGFLKGVGNFVTAPFKAVGKLFGF